MTSDRNHLIAASLRSLREKAGLTQAQAADKAGIPRSTLSEWEHGRNLGSIRAYLGVLAAIGADTSSFLNYDGGSETPAN